MLFTLALLLLDGVMWGLLNSADSALSLGQRAGGGAGRHDVCVLVISTGMRFHCRRKPVKKLQSTINYVSGNKVEK
ncbi:hypothetical protein ACLBR5_28325 [Escherichia coli]